MKDLITSITKISDGYDEKYMKIRFNSGGELLLIKMIKIHSIIIVARSVSQKNNEYYPKKMFLDKCL